MRPTTNRSGSAVCIALVLLLLFVYGCARDERPNLIIVLVDTLRADHLGYHGYERDTSPTIDALADSSIRFMNHYSHASRTGPAVASIFTGLHPRSHGVVNPLTHFDAKGTLGDEQTTLAEILSENGYDCYGYVANINVKAEFGFAQGFDTYEWIEKRVVSGLERAARGMIQPAIAEEISAAATAKLADRREPFFLYLHYMETHTPYAAPLRYRFKYVDPDYDGVMTGLHLQLDEIIAGRLSADADDGAHLNALYDQEIRYFDDEFRKLLGFLDERGLRENTIIVFVADHGEEFFDHGSVLHGYTLYDEQLHVPCFIHDPRADSPRALDTITRHVDILPTLLELMDVPSTGDVQGRSLAPAFRGEDLPDSSTPVLAQASLRAVKTIQQQSFTLDGWKLIETMVPTPGEELYHVAEDPAESRDLLAEQPDVAARLRDEMRRFVETLPVGTGGVVELSEDDKARLWSLGYLK